jgi:hypothetical protein
MAGLTTDLLEHLNRNLTTRERVIKSPAQKAHDAGIMKTVNYLRQQAKERNIASMLNDERLMLTHSLNFDANSPEEKNSLQAAIDQLDESRRSFAALTTAQEAYKKMADTYSSKKKEAGLPLDAARDFFKSHSTRLSNILSGKTSHFEKILVRQRKDNLQAMRVGYIEIQLETLGIESP